MVVRFGHAEPNPGSADWRTTGTSNRGRILVVLFDRPALGDLSTARIVTAWIARGRQVGAYPE